MAQGIWFVSHFFASCVSQKTFGHARIACENARIARDSRMVWFFDSRNVQKRATKSDTSSHCLQCIGRKQESIFKSGAWTYISCNQWSTIFVFRRVLYLLERRAATWPGESKFCFVLFSAAVTKTGGWSWGRWTTSLATGPDTVQSSTPFQQQLPSAVASQPCQSCQSQVGRRELWSKTELT